LTVTSTDRRIVADGVPSTTLRLDRPRPSFRTGDEPDAVLDPVSDDALASWRAALERLLELWA
jgi:hypothetical protein